MRIETVTESGFTLVMVEDSVAFNGPVPQGFLFARSTPILQVARDLRIFLLRGVQVTLCNGRFDFHNAEDPESLRAHLTAWGTKGKTVEEVEDEIIRWVKDRPKKSQATVDTWEYGKFCIVRLPWDTSYPYNIFQQGVRLTRRFTLTEALDYARRNS